MIEVVNMLTRIWRHISRRRRAQLGFLFCVMIIASFAELFSIGMVMPFLGVLTSPETIYENRFVRPLAVYWGLVDPEDLLLPATVGFVAAVVLAGSIRLLLVSMQARISLGIVNELATSTYHRTLQQPYSIHISRNSSEVISGILSKVSTGIGGVVGATLVMISSLVILIFILVGLVAINPVVALSSLFSFGVLYLVIVLLTKKKIARDSELISSASTEVVKVLQEGLGGIRDVILSGTQAVYSNAFREVDISLRRAQANVQIISIGPRFVIEALGMVLIALIAYIFTVQAGGFVAVVPVLGALAIGAQKILPLVHQAYSSWALILGSKASLRDALTLLEQPVFAEDMRFLEHQKLEFSHSIRLRNVSFRYGPQTPYVLRELSFSLPKGSRTGFIGVTGSGKSTLVDIIMGLLQPTDGCLLVDDRVVTLEYNRSWQRHIAHVPQAIFLADATIAENIAFGLPRAEIDLERVKAAAKQAQISGTIEALVEQYNTPVGERGVKLSGGQRQRIGIARALYKRADVIIFDEATSALDNETEQAVMEAIDGLGNNLTIVIIAHRLTTLKGCNKIVELHNGSVKRVGTYSDLVENEII